jgi:hypothetical protein
MYELTLQDVECVAGAAGWAVFVLPIVIGFVTGGPIGAGIAVGGVIATAGVNNLEFMHKNQGRTPSIHDMWSGK